MLDGRKARIVQKELEGYASLIAQGRGGEILHAK
jgi:hypothetical protein